MYERRSAKWRLCWFWPLLWLASAAMAESAGNDFYTWRGIGPDKWASAWLIVRHIDPQARLHFIETGASPPAGVAFDIPTIPPYLRDARHTTYERLAHDYRVDDPAVLEIGRIIRDIEINYWGAPDSKLAPQVENAFRGLQLRYGRENVPEGCYFTLFDAVHDHLGKGLVAADPATLETALMADRTCASVTRTTALADRKYVAEWHPVDILGFLGAGDRVVFVDTRESDEFDEGHIPGAINIRLRDIADQLPVALAGADIVIPYCVKDFRGFEVAKKLKRLGARHVGLMKPWGISGWKASGLPVAGTRGLARDAAYRRLRACIDTPTQCVKDG